MAPYAQGLGIAGKGHPGLAVDQASACAGWKREGPPEATTRLSGWKGRQDGDAQPCWHELQVAGIV